MPIPDTWSLPHSRHLSHPTQSMMRETFRKCVLNCSFRSYDNTHQPFVHSHEPRGPTTASLPAKKSPSSNPVAISLLPANFRTSRKASFAR